MTSRSPASPAPSGRPFLCDHLRRFIERSEISLDNITGFVIIADGDVPLLVHRRERLDPAPVAGPARVQEGPFRIWDHGRFPGVQGGHPATGAGFFLIAASEKLGLMMTDGG